MSTQRIIMLGPQRTRPTVREAVESLGLAAGARVAAVTAGWEEREPEDLELGEHLGAGAINLKVFQRADDIYRSDPELHQAMRDRQDTLQKLQMLYRLRLSHALLAARELLQREDPDEALLDPEREAAIEAVREIDRHHLRRITEIHRDFEERWRFDERPSVVHQQEELKQQLEGTEALLIAGGHVGILRNRMRLLDVLGLVGDRPIIGWSGGAMVLGEKIVLFHDSPPQGPGDAEVLGPGLGACSGVVPLPHAARRLRLDDHTRVELFARRFGSDICATLDDGGRVDWDGARWIGRAATQRLDADGTLAEIGAA